MKFPDPEEGRLDLVRPDPILVLTNAISGTLMIVMVIVSAMFALSILPILAPLLEAVQNPARFGWALQTIAKLFGLPVSASPYQIFRFGAVLASLIVFITFYIPFAVRTFWIGFKRLARAFLQWRNTSVPDAITDLANPLDVLRKMSTREKYSNNWKDPSATSLFGVNLQYLSPFATEVAGTIAARVADWGARFVRILVAAAAVSALIAFAHFTNVITAVLQTGLWASLSFGLQPFLAMVFMTVMVIILEYWFVALLTPRRAWPSESLASGDRVVASTPPNLISEEFPARIARYQFNDGPNSVYQLSNEIAATSVSDTGNFHLFGLIERRPLFLANPHRGASLFWLFCGWVLQFAGLGVLLFFLIPPVFREAILSNRLPDAAYSLTPILQFGLIAFGLRASAEGLRMVVEAERMLDSCWFVSSAIGYNLRGTTSRSEINIGRGQSDSIHTSSTVYRSEFLYSLTTVSLLSESVNIDGARSVVGMMNTPESSQLLSDGMLELREIIETRAAPVRVDLSDEGVHQQMDVNMMIDGVRTRRVESMRLEARREARARGLSAPPRPPQISGPDEEF